MRKRAIGMFRKLTFRKALVTCSVIALLFVCWLLLSPDKALPPLPFATGPYISTSRPTFGISANPSFLERHGISPWQLMQKYREKHPNPDAYSFPVSPVTSCSIHGLLNQCMEICGTRYLLPRDVAAGSVRFGNSNVLNGAQWVAAFEGALQSNAVDWWDSSRQASHHENLVLLRFPEQKTVLVLPKTAAMEFQRTNHTAVVSNQPNG